MAEADDRSLSPSPRQRAKVLSGPRRALSKSMAVVRNGPGAATRLGLICKKFVNRRGFCGDRGIFNRRPGTVPGRNRHGYATGGSGSESAPAPLAATVGYVRRVGRSNSAPGAIDEALLRCGRRWWWRSSSADADEAQQRVQLEVVASLPFRGVSLVEEPDAGNGGGSCQRAEGRGYSAASGDERRSRRFHLGPLPGARSAIAVGVGKFRHHRPGRAKRANDKVIVAVRLALHLHQPRSHLIRLPLRAPETRRIHAKRGPWPADAPELGHGASDGRVVDEVRPRIESVFTGQRNLPGHACIFAVAAGRSAYVTAALTRTVAAMARATSVRRLGV
jgi:hypothetical protein